MTSKRTMLLAALVAGLLLIASGGRTWVSGALEDAVLRSSTLSIDGNGAAPGVVALGLVGLAAAVATATGGRVVRWIGAVVTVLAGLGAVAQVVGVLVNPSGIVGKHAAEATGRTGAIAAEGSVTVWVWVALAGAVLLAVAGLTALLGIRSWSGLSSRYDAPTGRRPAQVASDWERLSEGEDPTIDGRATDADQR